MNKATQQEIADFCKEVGLPTEDAEWVFWKWESNNWSNGNKAIKNWRATIRCWKAGGFFPSQKTGKFNAPIPPSQSGIIRGWGTPNEQRA